MSKRYNLRRTAIFHDYYSRLKTIALSAFEWQGLPDSCNAKFLENSLFNYGRAVFVEDPDLSYLTLNVNQSDILNVYNEPIGYEVFGTGYSKYYKAKECVYIRNNLLEKSTDSTILIYAERLARIETTFDTNINAQKTPILIKCDGKTKNTLEAIYNQFEGDKPAIYAHKALQDKPLEILKTDAPFIADKLREEKRAVWNEALEYLGFNTNPSDKKRERLIISEVESNNQQIKIQAETMLLCRQQACEEINKKYGLSASVKRRVQEKEEGVINGEVFNRT